MQDMQKIIKSKTILLMALLLIIFLSGCLQPKCENGKTKACTINGCAGTQTCFNGKWGSCGNTVCGSSETRSNETAESCEDCIGTSYGLSLQDNTGITDARINFMVAHYDWLHIKPVSKENVAKIRAAADVLNPDFKIIKYTNAPFDFTVNPTGESNFAHSKLSTNYNYRIKEISKEYGSLGWYAMDLCSQDWRQSFTNKANELASYYNSNIDGIFVDDMGMAGGIKNVDRIDYTPQHQTGGNWVDYTNEEWSNCGKDFLAYTNANFPGIVVFNGLYHNGPFWDREYLGVSDGGMREGWITADYQTFISKTYWKTLLDWVIEDLNSYHAKIWVACRMKNDVAAITDNRMFCFTSYLLINEPGRVIYGSPSHVPLTFNFEPELTVDLGIPVEYAPVSEGVNHYFDGRVYVREYSKGLVIVNPDETTSFTYNPQGTYYLVTPQGSPVVGEDGSYSGSLSFEPVTEITIPPQTGRILVNYPPKS